MAFVLEVRGRTVAGKRDDLLALFETHLAPRAETNQAQRLVIWVADDADPDGFVLFEMYRDRAAADANAQTDWFAKYMGAAGPLLCAPPVVTTGTPMWTKGVPH